MNHIQYKKIKNYHKAIQALALKERQTLGRYDRIFLRHWNVFYNQLRGHELSRIEQFSRTPLYPQYVQHIAKLFKLELESIQADYSEKGAWEWMMNYSNIAKKALEVK